MDNIPYQKYKTMFCRDIYFVIHEFLGLTETIRSLNKVCKDSYALMKEYKTYCIYGNMGYDCYRELDDPLDEPIVEYYIKKYVIPPSKAFRSACRSGNIKYAKSLMSRYQLRKKDFKKTTSAVLDYNQMVSFDWMIQEKIIDYERMFYGFVEVCSEGQVEMGMKIYEFFRDNDIFDNSIPDIDELIEAVINIKDKILRDKYLDVLIRDGHVNEKKLSQLLEDSRKIAEILVDNNFVSGETCVDWFKDNNWAVRDEKLFLDIVYRLIKTRHKINYDNLLVFCTEEGTTDVVKAILDIYAYQSDILFGVIVNVINKNLWSKYYTVKSIVRLKKFDHMQIKQLYVLLAKEPMTDKLRDLLFYMFMVFGIKKDMLPRHFKNEEVKDMFMAYVDDVDSDYEIDYEVDDEDEVDNNENYDDEYDDEDDDN